MKYGPKVRASFCCRLSDLILHYQVFLVAPDDARSDVLGLNRPFD